MIPPPRRILRERFLHLQGALKHRLEGDRLIHHPGKKGSASEEGCRQMLADYLPKRYPLDLSAPDAALIFFFLRLLERLQQVGTVTAMKIREYAKVLED